MIVLVYVDDCLLFAYDDEVIDNFVNDLKKHHELDEQEMESDVYAFLGIQVDMKGNNVELKQVGLIDKVLKTMGMSECTPNETPSKETPLHSDVDGAAFQEEWDYASVVGMLMYLVHTRPDIQFAVHQCAKFTHNPKQSHGNAVKKIVRYLRGTREQGLRFSKRPTTETIRLDCFVDASFAPLFGYEHYDDPKNAESRTGYLIRLDDVPVAWCSTGQGQTIALSTTEAEYIALSTAMRELIWLRRVVDEIATGMEFAYNKVTVIKSKVFEDNQGAIAVANRAQATARTRHLNTKYHHFKHHLKVHNGDGIELEYISTDKQLADMLTKGLGPSSFKRLRNKLMGWNTIVDKVSTGSNRFGERGNVFAREGELKSLVSWADI